MDHHRGTFGVFKGDPVIMGESHKIWMHAQGGGKGGRRRGGMAPPLDLPHLTWPSVTSSLSGTP